MAVVEFDNVCYRYAAHGSAADGFAAGGSAAGREAAGANGTAARGEDDTEGGDAANDTDAGADPAAAGSAAGSAATGSAAGHAASQSPGRSSGRNVLDRLSLDIEPGEFIAVIGANGSGKSTLAKHVNGLLTPVSGRVLTVGLDTTDPDTIFELRSHAGMVFQNPDSQMVASIVADDVAFGCENLAVPYDEMAARVDAALSSVKMSDFAQRNPAHLSGGQKQRVCIAGVLAMQPEILILDEPGAMLDVRGRRGVRRIVRELNKSGMTIILITHFMEEAMLAERVYLIDRGRIALSGSPTEIFSQKQKLRELSMDLPFSLLLAEGLRQRSLPVSELVSPKELKKELRCWHNGMTYDPAAAPVASSEAALPAALPAVPKSGLPDALADTPAGGRAATPKPDQPAAAHTAAATQPAPSTPAPSLPTAAHMPAAAHTAAASPPLLALDKLGYTYSSHDGQVHALLDIDLHLHSGDFLGIIGHTGSGKSTLLQLMSGLLMPTAGSVRFDGESLRGKTVRRKLFTQVGIAFQYPEYQLFAPTVYDDIAFALRNAGMAADEIEQRVRESMQLMRLDFQRFAPLSPFELSGGEMRRVALAGVIALKPRLLILDEPTAGLDPAGRNQLNAIIAEYHATGATVVLVSHGMDTIARLATRVLVLKDGQTAYLGSPAEVFAHADELRALNLGVPQATAFAAELQALGLPLPKGILTIDELADAIAALKNVEGVRHTTATAHMEANDGL